MNSEKFEELTVNAAQALEGKVTALERKLQARRTIEIEVERMKQEGKAFELSDEEIRMLAAFKRFKSSCKSGDVFKWQTRPNEGVLLHSDTSLVRDPQEIA